MEKKLIEWSDIEQIGLIPLLMCTSTLINFRASINLTLTSVKYPK